jgi:hydrogenase expression/formation protein HypE
MSNKLGKIQHHLFDQFISNKCGINRSEVIAGAQFGVDVSLIELHGGMAMALTSDPLTLIPSFGLQESAWLSVHLMANDMATTGFAPMYAQFVLNLPATFSKSDFNIYWNFIHQFCSQIGVSITGGHTGFIDGQNSTIAGGGTFIAIAPKEKMLVSSLAKPGNDILVTKSCAISSAAILAMSFPETVKRKAGTEIYQQACNSFYQTSSLNDALIAIETGNYITAMHDVTEGGVLGAIYELAIASNNGAVIYNNKLPIQHVQQSICNIFDIDPRCSIGAGSMIITCEKKGTETVVKKLADKNIDCVCVGEIVDKENGIMLCNNEEITALEYKEEDPYWAAFFKAFHSGLK